jgi:hypothetical protein
VGLAVGALLVLGPAAPAGAVNGAFFGIVPTNSPSAEEFEAMGQANVGTVRFQIDWRDVQPTEGGPYNWSGTDAQVTNAALNGVELLPFVYGTPGYASGGSREPPLGSDEAKEAWMKFVTAAAERYGPDGAFWDEFTAANPGVRPRPFRWLQIWNEQNSPAYYHPKPSVKEYAELVRISDQALGDAGSGIRTVLGGMFGTPQRDKGIFAWKYLKRLFKKNGIKRRVDAVALHPYSPNLAGVKAQIRLARKKLRKTGAGKVPIWITELGWGSAGTNGHSLIKSRAGQKKMLRKSFNLILDRRGKWKIRRLMWFTWRDPANPTDPVGVVCTWCASAGLFDREGDPKPALDQFRRFAGAS